MIHPLYPEILEKRDILLEQLERIEWLKQMTGATPSVLDLDGPLFDLLEMQIASRGRESIFDSGWMDGTIPSGRLQVAGVWIVRGRSRPE